MASGCSNRVPLWFHTFALNAEHGLYTPGVARDHRYRVPALPPSFEGLRVLDVGTFDGFYAYLAEHRGAARVLAVDNEQYIGWVQARWGITLKGGEGFRAIGELIGSRVEYLRGDALALPAAGERFDLAFCFGILHRVENPPGRLRALAGLLSPGGRVLVETYGMVDDGRVDQRTHRGQAAGRGLPGRRLRLLGLRVRRTGCTRPPRGTARDRGDQQRDGGRAPADPGHAQPAGRLSARGRAVSPRRP